MPRMIMLSDGCCVAADHIVEVTVNRSATGLTVRTKDGIGHVVSNDYGKSSYETLSRLIKEINDG